MFTKNGTGKSVMLFESSCVKPTSGVERMRSAGVLLVFCYLIVPSVAAMLFAKDVGKRLAIGWTTGTVVSALGVYLSLRLDLPTGAAIVCTFGVVLILMALVRVFLLKPGVMCNEAAIRILGLSLAGWNAIICGTLALFAFRTKN